MEKKEIAVKQLEDAAFLYEKNRYVSALTLAGAAEEILGKMAKKRRGWNQFENEKEYLKSIYRFFNKPIPPDKKLVKDINNAKNELKHNDEGENLWVDCDFENEFVLLFVKAVKNYFNTYGEMPNSKIISELFEFLTL